MLLYLSPKICKICANVFVYIVSNYLKQLGMKQYAYVNGVDSCGLHMFFKRTEQDVIVVDRMHILYIYSLFIVVLMFFDSHLVCLDYAILSI